MNKMNKVANHFLTESYDDVEEVEVDEAASTDLEQVYANYVNGNIGDFKNQVRDAKTLASLILYLLEDMQTDPNEIIKISQILAR